MAEIQPQLTFLIEKWNCASLQDVLYYDSLAFK